MQTQVVVGLGGAGVATAGAPVVARPASTQPRGQSDVPSPQRVAQAVSDANSALKAIDPSLQFEVDPETNITVIKVIDTDGKTVLRQVPAPEMIEIAQSLGRLQGLLLKQEA